MGRNEGSLKGLRCMKQKVAIVILNWNGRDMLERFLPGVMANSAQGNVIVADNGSTDDSIAWVRANAPNVNIIELDKNYGFAEGYNRALREVEAEYYVLLNSDVEVPEGWLAPLLSYMEAHADVAACQPKLLCQWQKESFEYAGAAGGFIDQLGYPYCRGRVLTEVERDAGQYDSIAPCHWATGACLFIRSADYWQAGGLDPTFFAHQEEIDLCWRLVARGRSIVCIPESVVYHVGGATLQVGSPRKTYLNFRNNLIMIYKNAWRLRPILFARLWLDALAAAHMLVGGEWSHVVAVCRAWAHFIRDKRKYEEARERNLSLAVVDPLANAPRSILWHYYFRRRKTYAQIHNTI